MTFGQTIRRAGPLDLTEIKDCAFAAYNIYVSAIGRKPAPMVADFEPLIAERLVWLAPRAGFIVMYPRGRALHIENVAVHPNAQGQGVGKRLMDYAEKHAHNLGLDRIELYTNAKMEGPLRLYPKLGYTETDRRYEDGFDRVYYKKRLKK